MAGPSRDLDVKERESTLAEGEPARQKRRAPGLALRTPDWKLYETPNYFILSDNPDKAFLEELMHRLPSRSGRSTSRTTRPRKAKELRDAIPRRRPGPRR
jgi:hypothetical protein